MIAYLDNSATTRASEHVTEAMVRVMREDYGNPSSMHMYGVQAERLVRSSREQIARTLKVTEKEILFTSGGTESNNLAIIGTAMAKQRTGKHIITTSVEHPSVHAAMEYLEKQGFRITYLPVDAYGVISMEDLKTTVCEDTILVSVMYVNNEVGATMPIEEIGDYLSKYHPGITFHVDAVQAYGKMEVYPKRFHIDLLSVSAHKIHGPKGIGFLYVKDKTKILPILFGGGQQKGMRSGTENVPGIVGLGIAAEESYQNLQANRAHLYELKSLLIQGLQKLPDVVLHGHLGEDSAPHVVHASFPGIRSEVLLHALEAEEIYVSAGSACASNKKSESSTLEAMGLPAQEKESAIRFSLCSDNTREEIAYTLKVLEGLLPKLRIYRRR